MHCYLIPRVDNERYVESMGNKLKQHNPPHQNITSEHLEEELIVGWNGPGIHHSDKLIKDTVGFGVGQWHFQRLSTASRLILRNNSYLLFCAKSFVELERKVWLYYYL